MAVFRVVLLLMAHAGMIDSATLIGGRRYAIVIIFAVAAFITPPDLISQIALGTPILLLYEMSIWLIRLQEKQTLKTATDLPSKT